MNTMGNATGDLMANWMTSGGVLLAQDVYVADDMGQELSAATATQAASCPWFDPEIRNVAASCGAPTCPHVTDVEISAAQGSHQFRCAAS
tara:strand:- start:175 stop:444 length:270 start_codon:yes stop_codon:yes gene_type:complete